MDLTANKILSIPLTDPELLFTKDGIKEEYKHLAKIWHPVLYLQNIIPGYYII